MRTYLIQAFVLLLFSSFQLNAQENEGFDIDCNVNKIYPSISINELNLRDAQTLTDLDRYFKPSWVQTYESVELTVLSNGKRLKSVGRSNELTTEQKELIVKADLGSEIKVKVRYIPDNTLKHNDLKTHRFSCLIDPSRDAQFNGGEEALNNYLKEHILDHLPEGTITQYKLAAVKFNVNEEGDVENTNLFWSSDDTDFDKLMIEAICNMPKWQPAAFANGTKTTQEFAFRIGDMFSCISNMLNTSRRPVE